MTIRADIGETPDRDAPTCAQDVTVRPRKRSAEPRPRGGSNVLLALVLAGAAYTYFMYVKTGPQTANAADTAASASAVRTFVTAAPANVKGMERLLKSSKKAVAQLAAFQNVRQIPLADLRTNPFGENDASVVKTHVDQQRSAALRAVQKLQLQSVWIDDNNRSCVINNAILMEGQQVDQFTVETISASAVVVRTGAFRFELRSQR